MKKTKILCTIGPVSIFPEVIEKMYQAGMNGVRINTAFGNFDQYEKIIKNVRRVGEIPLLLDLKGPEIRVKLAKPIEIKANNLIEIGRRSPIKFSHEIYDQLNVNDNVLINNGNVSMRVVKRGKNQVQLIVLRGGRVDNGKGVNIPSKPIIVPSLSEKDLQLIKFARKNDIEFIALSFVREKKDLTNLKDFAYDLKAEIIAKIENQQGVKNFEEILKEADGIIVARGDLGIEMDLERVPLVQKHIILRCNQEGKLAITATQMLESMTDNPVPTRAEVSDVANAILDGTDTLMLSGETAVGNYPIEAVSLMSKIAKKIEPSTKTNVREEEFRNISSTISRSIWQIAEKTPVDKVVTLTRTGYTAKVITRFKLRQPIIAITTSKMVKKQLELYYGVQSIYFDYEKEKDRILAVTQMLCKKGILRGDENVLFTAGVRTTKPHSSNLIEIHMIGELLEFGNPHE